MIKVKGISSSGPAGTPDRPRLVLDPQVDPGALVLDPQVGPGAAGRVEGRVQILLVLSREAGAIARERLGDGIMRITHRVAPRGGVVPATRLGPSEYRPPRPTPIPAGQDFKYLR